MTGHYAHLTLLREYARLTVLIKGKYIFPKYPYNPKYPAGMELVFDRMSIRLKTKIASQSLSKNTALLQRHNWYSLLYSISLLWFLNGGEEFMIVWSVFLQQFDPQSNEKV